MGRRFLQLNGYKRALGTIPRPDLKPWPVFGHVLIRAGPHYNHREAGGDKLSPLLPSHASHPDV